jgi:hypothetical protein
MTAIQWGNVPDWITIAGNLGPVLFRSIQRVRIKQAQEWPTIVQDLAQLSPEASQEVLDTNPAITQLIGRAWATATESTAEGNRRLLAKVGAEAIKDPTNNDRLDELRFLERALATLEPPHIRLLIAIGRPRQETGQFVQTQLEGYLTPADLIHVWPEAREFILPMTALLAREGLIENRGADTFAGVPAWGVSPFGRRFLAFLADEPAWNADVEGAEIALRLEEAGPVGYPKLVARNLGPGMATEIQIAFPTRRDGRSILVDDAHPEPFELLPEQEQSFALYPYTISDHPPYSVKVRWYDSHGVRARVQTLNRRGPVNRR